MRAVRKVKEIVRNFIDITRKDVKKLAISSIAIGVISGAILYFFVHIGTTSYDILSQITAFQITTLLQITAFIISLIGGVIISFRLTSQFSWRLFYFVLSAILIYHSFAFTILFFAIRRFHNLERNQGYATAIFNCFGSFQEI